MSDHTSFVELTPETLGQIDAFRELALAEREKILPFCDYRFYEAGQYVVAYKDDSKDVFFIVSGRAQAINYGTSGHQVTLQDVEAGQMFGEISAIDGETRSAHVVTVVESKIFSVTPDNFMRILENHPAVAKATLRRLAGMVRNLGQKVYYRDALPANQRVRAELLRLAFERGQSQNSTIVNSAIITPAPTHTEIAHHIGTSRETVTRELAILRSEELIKRHDDGLMLCDISRLTQTIGKVPEPEKPVEFSKIDSKK